MGVKIDNVRADLGQAATREFKRMVLHKQVRIHPNDLDAPKVITGVVVDASADWGQYHRDGAIVFMLTLKDFSAHGSYGKLKNGLLSLEVEPDYQVLEIL